MAPFAAELHSCRWCPYILKCLAIDEVMYGRGWHAHEGSFRWNGPNAELQFIASHEHFCIELQLSLPDPNIMIDATLGFFVEAVRIRNDYQLVSELVGSGRLDLNGHGRERLVRIPVAR